MPEGGGASGRDGATLVMLPLAGCVIVLGDRMCPLLAEVLGPEGVEAEGEVVPGEQEAYDTVVPDDDGISSGISSPLALDIPYALCVIDGWLCRWDCSWSGERPWAALASLRKSPPSNPK